MEPPRTDDPPPITGRTDQRAAPPAARGSALRWGLAIGVLAATGLGVYVWRQQEPPAPTPQAQAPPAPAVEAAPAIEYPLPALAPEPPLPALAASDALLVAALVELAGAGVRELLQLPGLVQRIVVTVDNLPRQRIAPEQWPLRPAPGRLRVSGGAQTPVIDPSNAARYAAYVTLLERLDSERLVALYVRTYPLFQQAYVDLGYPHGYFNDRLLHVLDHLLATPQPAGALRLAQPGVLYEFADPSLQAQSIGRKALLRIGPENAARVKAKLGELRAEILRHSARR